MKSIAILLFSIGYGISSYAQYKYENFNKGLPEKWSTTSKIPLSLSSEHYKDGNQSLKWEPKDKDVITISSLSIPKEETIGPLASEIFVYSKYASSDTLIFQFLDPKGKVQRSGRMMLNYSGWREYHRSFGFDYNKGSDSEPFELNECRIIYKSGKGSKSNTIYFDAVRFTGNKDLRRQTAPHTQIDSVQFKKIGLAGGNPLESWLNKPSGKVIQVSENEFKDIEELRKKYASLNKTIDKTELAASMEYIRHANLKRNDDHSIKGKGILAISKSDTLVKISGYCGVLGRSYLMDKNKESRDALVLFTEYLLDQGLAEGGRNVLPTNSYENARKFPLGFLDALDAYPSEMRAKVLAMLKWSHEYNQIYNENLLPGVNTDFIHLKLETLFKLALANPVKEDVVRDLRYLSKFMERCIAISQGGNDGIKPDGAGFHHHSAHMNYMVAFSTWINRAYSLKGTSFRVSKAAYENMSYAIKTLLSETSDGKFFPHSLTGRNPFSSSSTVKKESVAKLIEIGDDLNIKSNDMKAFYNYLYKENKYPVKKEDLDGFYQLNYAQLGILRKDNWIAAMRGFTSRMFGAEIYDKQNRYGRYQSYGSLEVLYNGDVNSTGYLAKGKGWDWNVIPGTTTIHLPWNKLTTRSLTATEFQKKNFAGSLSLGKNGIFGMDFQQDARGKYTPDNLVFRKSVFAFNNILVCLGSHINAKTDVGNVATNLFQSVFVEHTPEVVISDKAVSANTISEGNNHYSIAVEQNGLWLINGVKTGYYIPKGNDKVEILTGEQETPDYSSHDGKKKNKALTSKAWINHGKEPVNVKYHFVVVPQTSSDEMKSISSKIERNEIYTVLEQTDSIHIVKYIPESLTSYVFFEPMKNVKTGYVQSISKPCLLGIKDVSGTVSLSIASPDLNAVADQQSYWKSTISKISLQLKGRWKVLENKNNAEIHSNKEGLNITFSLIHGFSNNLVLKKDN
ncbi:polysaccharide lyase family 8 super-sandwich domain-containing protein [Pedobacter sp. ASV1-7]|uniref:polysaccharide lyase family 8 super-sandwich domain-containing protein n=1 Tax=Pedobacter sp. ASV1-7 TaxID=3145237 RepID=UPI0032E92FA4